MVTTEYIYNAEDLTRFANLVKEIILSNLIDEKFITNLQGTNLAENMTIVVSRPGVLGRLFDKVVGKSNDKEKISILFKHIK